MFENPRRDSSEQIFSENWRWVPLIELGKRSAKMFSWLTLRYWLRLNLSPIIWTLLRSHASDLRSSNPPRTLGPRGTLSPLRKSSGLLVLLLLVVVLPNSWPSLGIYCRFPRAKHGLLKAAAAVIRVLPSRLVEQSTPPPPLPCTNKSLSLLRHFWHVNFGSISLRFPSIKTFTID